MVKKPYKLIVGDSREAMRKMRAGSVHCCVTSPPYYRQRDYQADGQIGQEKTVGQYVETMVDVFREVKRVLRDDATLWLNLGSTYCSANQSGRLRGTSGRECRWKQKDLMPVPWLVALALQNAGWILRSDIIWHKPNAMPSSVKDRPTTIHEYLFLLAKSKGYYYDHVAIQERAIYPCDDPGRRKDSRRGTECNSVSGATGTTRNKRSVWSIVTSPYKEAHFAVFPPKLVTPCIKAGTSQKGCCPKCGAPWMRIVEEARVDRDRPNKYVKRSGEAGTGNAIDQTWGGVETKTLGWEPSCDHNRERVPCVVLDPFSGSGTTVAEAVRRGRRGIGIELNEDYNELAKSRVERALSKRGFGLV